MQIRGLQLLDLLRAQEGVGHKARGVGDADHGGVAGDSVIGHVAAHTHTHTHTHTLADAQ